MSTTVIPSGSDLERFVFDVTRFVEESATEQEVTGKVAEALTALLAAGLELPESVIRPDPTRYVMYPLYVDPDNRFSIASAVWDKGQQTPVHGHETWGVVGIWSGVERETRFVKPLVPDVPLESEGTDDWVAGQVTVCCTTDDDVHQVSSAGDEPCVGIHVYGGDIGTLSRRSYVPETGAVSWFVSTWRQPDAGAATVTTGEGA
jgi:3-mercaptopropionate dioxygenase